MPAELVRAPRPCQDCGAVRLIHGYACCEACYRRRYRAGALPVRVTHRLPCRDCGVRLIDLRYRRKRVRRQRCPACYERWWCRARAAAPAAVGVGA